MSAVVFDGEDIPLTIIRSARRKTIGLTVKESGEVILRIPPHVTEEKAVSFAQSKAEWIVRHRAKFESRKRVERHYAEGETIPFFGRELTIRRIEGDKVRAEILEGELLLTGPAGTEADVFREAVIFLFRRGGLKHLRPIVSEVAKAAGVEPPMLRIREQQRKWGCCTPKNGIILNVRVLLAPELVIRYLVVHEVAHLEHRHHQDSFWAEVERLMPEFREAEQVLKEQGWMWVF